MIGGEIKELKEISAGSGGGGVDMQWTRIIDIVLSVTFFTFTMLFSWIMYLDFKKRLKDFEIEEEMTQGNQNMQN